MKEWSSTFQPSDLIVIRQADRRTHAAFKMMDRSRNYQLLRFLTNTLVCHITRSMETIYRVTTRIPLHRPLLQPTLRKWDQRHKMKASWWHWPKSKASAWNWEMSSMWTLSEMQKWLMLLFVLHWSPRDQKWLFRKIEQVANLFRWYLMAARDRQHRML